MNEHATAQRRPRLRFSLRLLIFATAVVAVFFGLRSGFVYGQSDVLPDIVGRALYVPPIIAVIVCAYRCATLRPATGRRRALIWQSMLIGSSTAAMTGTILGIEIAEVLRRETDYWDWWNDWPTIAFFLVGQQALYGGLVGLFVGSIWGVRSTTPLIHDPRATPAAAPFPPAETRRSTRS